MATVGYQTDITATKFLAILANPQAHLRTICRGPLTTAQLLTKLPVAQLDSQR